MMKTLCIAAAAALALAAPVAAQSAGEWTLGFGIGGVQPKSNNGTVAGATLDVGNNTRPTITAEYFIRDNLGVELLAATPFKHKVSLGGAEIGTVKHLPPTLSLNWHVETGTQWKPFVGVGVNFTTFFSEKSPLGDLKLKNTWGPAVNLGTDYWISDKAAIRANVRWIGIKSDVHLNGTKVGEARIDPVVWGASYVMKF
ncbi:MAG: OmpW family outer membrane protein [Paracoccus sp. (in: a-proteobacteria)]|nr:OmpW family outer membrane protein [Paracoccus sp. (in: a-proteobacteria)]